MSVFLLENWKNLVYLLDILKPKTPLVKEVTDNLVKEGKDEEKQIKNLKDNF